MKVFITGGSGYIGSVVVPLLLDAGHSVLALARSPESAAKLNAFQNVEVVQGDLNDVEVLKEAASRSDAVIHLGFNHDFGNFAKSAQTDLDAIKAIGEVLAGTGKAFIGTSGTGIAIGVPGVLKEDFRPSNTLIPRVELEKVLLALKDVGVRSLVVRLPFTVHGPGKKGFIPTYVEILKSLGAAEYVGDGNNKWPAVNLADAALLYKLVLEKGTAGSIYHGIGEQGIPFKDIAAEVAKGLNVHTKSILNAQAQEDYLWLAMFVLADVQALSEATQKELGWKPVHGGLFEDIKVYTS